MNPTSSVLSAQQEPSFSAPVIETLTRIAENLNELIYFGRTGQVRGRQIIVFVEVIRYN